MIYAYMKKRNKNINKYKTNNSNDYALRSPLVLLRKIDVMI